MSQAQVYSVSEITRTIKLLLEENIPPLWIQGEISNFKAHYSGHYYFTLKDENAQISAVMWKSRTANLTFVPEDGMLVQALGSIRVYERSGRYQIDVVRMQPAGVGRLQMEFERLKNKLKEEGLFDPEFKKPLPAFAHKIGVVTSETGAAVRDIINVLKRRAPHIEIILRPAKVQGEGAAADIARAIEEFNEFGQVDLLIVGRGGGSLEDLWAFNEETVARAIYQSRLPVISAVGHEIDFTIADFVADMRAPTPSAAAEIAVPDYVMLKSSLTDLRDRLLSAIKGILQQYREKINALQRSYGLRRPEDLLKQYAFQLDELTSRLRMHYLNKIGRAKLYLEQVEIRLTNLNPKKVLERGYSITYLGSEIIRRAAQIKKGQNIRTEFSSGQLNSTVTEVVADDEKETKL